MLKKLILLGVISTAGFGQIYVTEEMIYESVYQAAKNGITEVPNLIKFIYDREANNKKGFYWYFNRNQRMRTILNKHHIDYYTLIKQALYPKKPSDNSLESEKKKFAVLSTLMYKNDLIPKSKERKKKKKLKIDISEK